MKRKNMKIAVCLMTAALLTGIFPAEQIKAASWEQDGSRWKYQEDDGTYSKERWKCLNDKWYYFDADGYMKTDWFLIDGRWYFADDTGIMVDVWKLLGGKWYYFDAGGAMVTDWKEVGGKWYYFDAGGAMVTGWRLLGGKWYYFDESGAMITGWSKLGGKWYYFDKSGAMITGWSKLGGKWYYFEDTGAMYKNRWQDGKYFLGADGAMMINTITPDGCHVDANGVYIFEDPVVLHNYYSGLTSEQAAQADAVAWEIANTILEKLPADASDIDKVYSAAYVVSTLYCTPDRYGTDENKYYRSPYGPFVAEVYTCAGAVRALGRVLDYMGFHWKHINENQYTHQWCVLFMDGEIGYADASAAPIVGYGEYPFQ